MNTEPKSWNNKDAKSYDLSVVIGRFQPFHNGHKCLIDFAEKIANHTLVLVGSSYIARNMKNPFTYEERESMIELCHPNVEIGALVDDLYSNQVWIAQVQTAVYNYLTDLHGTSRGFRVAIVGHHKDESSWYLDAFPDYDYQEVGPVTADGTTLREMLFGSVNPSVILNMPKDVRNYLCGWLNRNGDKEFKRLQEEFRFIRDYKKKWEAAPYAPTFVTTDAVVICNGHILLIKRRVAPGKGLWALPGGFLNQEETIADATIRELVEETRIKVSEATLRASVKGQHVFDAPNRSLRGRTITHASLIVLNNKELPNVRGSDDAERAKWIPISKFYEMTEELYEDHYSIGTYMINRA